ncbi:uncharacterized protein PV07_09072 [Cladophialophora immunda]|uniref:Protein kinase domain-containing protein n=1 Tax=Cladophialophora immunda TaxID=569365 RepID=A0A0D2C416_9EURO|nr:uncharacterized protein PV07_09072 [Cladophialophora immunda]KIW25938.1 hypothetical protein PV07_09072 [Cladophialophora immunda]
MCRSNLNFFKKCRFIITGSDRRAETFIDRLRERNEVLRGFVYAPKDQQILLNQLFEMMARAQNPEFLETLYREETRAAKHGQKSLPYRELALTGFFSNAVQSRDPHRRARRLALSDIGPGIVVAASQPAEMAIFEHCPPSQRRRLIYIEWTFDEYYIDMTEAREKAEKMANMLGASKPGQLLLPYCYGYVEDKKNQRFGLVLAPPEHIRSGIPSMRTQGFVSQKRMPVSLGAILEAAQGRLEDLSIRFNLAKRLVNAVHKMHCVNWVHKNIRPGSIMFFPTEDTLSYGKERRQVMDFSQPLFVGFGRARVDSSDTGSRRARSRAPGQITLDEYQHPLKLQNPDMLYSRFFDIYSVGCVLLEIGYWRPLRKLVDLPAVIERKDTDEINSIRESMRQRAESLSGLTGSMYAGVVAKCLGAIPSGGTVEVDKAACSKFLAEIMYSLGKCEA